MGESPERAALFVATDLDHFETTDPDVYAADVTISGRCFRRLDPPYYAWLRRQMASAKRALDVRRLSADAFEAMRAAFNVVHAWAVRHFGEPTLVAAAKSFDAAKYEPPRSGDDDLSGCGVRRPSPAPRNPSGFVFPADGDWPFTEPVAADAVAKVDAIRAEALAVGWTEAALYQNRGSLRFPYGGDYGVVCFLGDGARIAAVAREAIAIEHVGGTPGSIPNPAVAQPWRRAVQAVPV
jgi:hypothetical protein